MGYSSLACLRLDYSDDSDNLLNGQPFDVDSQSIRTAIEFIRIIDLAGPLFWPALQIDFSRYWYWKQWERNY